MRIWKRLRWWMNRRRFEDDLAEEIRIHREWEREHRESGGAARYFGSTALALEESRKVWSFGWLDSLGQDLHYAWRGIRRAPAFALTIIGTIGLGLGLNTTLFTVFNTYVLRTIAVRDPHSLYEFWWTSRDGARRASSRQFEEARRENRVFTDVAAYDHLFASIDGRAAIGQIVSGNYFSLLGPGALLGRLIEPEDAATPGAGNVMVLSYRTWRNWYGSDPQVLGRKVFLRGQPFEVIGVAGPRFTGIGDILLDFWLPLSMASLVNPSPPELRLLGRLKPEVTREAARSAVLAWAQGNTAGLPLERRATNARMASRATPIEYSPQMLAAASPVFLAFGLVLAIACANVSNMMLARALSRQREMGIRVSLGAGRARLVRQLLTESLLLALPAAAAGMAISQATLRFAVWLLVRTMPSAFRDLLLRVPQIEADWRVFGFILLASAGATLLFGLAPAVQTTRSRLVEANRGDFSSDYRPARLRNMLVAMQVLVCVLLMICAGVTLRGKQWVSRQDVRMRTEGVFDLIMPSSDQAKAVERLRAAQGIEAVAAAWKAPLSGERVKTGVRPSGGHAEFLAGYNFVSPEYFSVLRIPLLRGRVFTLEEAKAGAAVVVISEATARRFWPGRDPIGETIEIPAKSQKDGRSNRLPAFRSARVIGVARDVISGFIGNGIDSSCLYFPTYAGAGNESLLVGVTGGKESGRRAIESALDQGGSSIADQINPLDGALETMVYAFRITFWIAGFLGALALLLTISGIFGVLSYLVSQRTKEIGIRMALGAGAAAVVRMVVWQSMRLVALGAAAGAGLARLLAPVFAYKVEAINPYDTLSYAGAILLVAFAALGASFRPAQKAVAVDPLAVLRCD